MALTWNGNFPQETVTTTITAAAPAGSALQYLASQTNGEMALATTKIEAYLVSEVVSATEWNNRMYLYGALDWSAYVAAGAATTTVSAVKLSNCTAVGLALVDSHAAISAGATLILDGTAGGRFKVGSTFASDPVVVLEAIASTAAYTGKVHIR